MSRMTKSAATMLTALICGTLAYAPSVSAAAQTVPLTVTQQGRLLDSTSAPVDSVALKFTFKLYTTPAGTASLWTETQTITPDQGYFSARLGEVTPFPATIFDGSQTVLYLGITSGSDTEMAPRQQLTSVPFAMLSLNATHATTADSAATAVGALNTRIAALETLTSCPDATARANYGFCIWHEDKGATYTLSYANAAKACIAKGGRLCTMAEVSAAAAAGAEWCAYSWVADRVDNTTGYWAFPMKHVDGACGNAIGLISSTSAMSAVFDANCCKP
jgi:Extracellular link domain